MSKRVTTKQFIEKANLIHNNKYDYSKVEYITAHKKVTIICREHGEFDQRPNDHLMNHACPKCADDIRAKMFSQVAKNSSISFIGKANKIHNDKYDYSKVQYITSSKKVIIICNNHGEFLQTPSVHLVGYGCPTCGRVKLQQVATKKANFSGSQFIKKANKIHKDKYDYSKVQYKAANKKIIIVCPKHGEFLQTPSDHLHSEAGCSKCTNRISKPETLWLDSLNVPNTSQNRQVTIHLSNRNWITADGYIPETKTVYEFWGDYWHGNPSKYDFDKINSIAKKTFKELYKQTQQKRTNIIEAGFNLIEIWESDWNSQKS